MPRHHVTREIIRILDKRAQVPEPAFDPINPHARVRRTTAQAISTGVTTALSFDAQYYDTHGFHSTTVNPTRLTMPQKGFYHVVGFVGIQANASGSRTVAILLNGSTLIAKESHPPHGTADDYFNPVTLVQLGVNDYLELVVFQDSGVTLNAQAVGAVSPEFAIVRVSNF